MKPKKKSQKKSEDSIESQKNEVKPLSLFDHVKHIQMIQSPQYFDNLSDVDKKSFSNFMVLKALSMNPYFIETASVLYRYLETLSPKMMYKVLIETYPKHGFREYHKWIKKDSDKDGISDELISVVKKHFNVGKRESIQFIRMMPDADLKSICEMYAMDEKEINEII